MRRIFPMLLVSFSIASCTLNNARIDNELKKHFDSHNVEGTFAMLNNQSGTITLYNMEMDTQKVSPLFTFNVINTLAGIEAGQITGADMKLTVNGETETLAQAWKQQNRSFFQEIARKTGEQNLKLWIDSLQYGNMNMSGSLDSFWFNDTLKISPDEQLGLMFQLYFDKLPFSKFAQSVVRNLMLKEENNDYRLWYVTGTGVNEKQNPVDWVAGWVEENRHVYFFVTYTKSKVANKNIQNTSWQIAESILKEKEFFKGIK